MENKRVSDSPNRVYRKKVSDNVNNKDLEFDKLKSSLKFGPDNVVQGIIYSEIFGKPKGFSRIRNR